MASLYSAVNDRRRGRATGTGWPCSSGMAPSCRGARAVGVIVIGQVIILALGDGHFTRPHLLVIGSTEGHRLVGPSAVLRDGAHARAGFRVRYRKRKSAAIRTSMN